jgi:excisionase family DNA binding protein
MTTDRPLEPLLSTDQVAEYLGIAVNTLEKWRVQGKGPAYHKLGVFIRYRKSDVDAWIDRQRINTTEDERR